MDNIMSRLFEDILRKIVLLLWGAALLMVGCSESDPATEGLGAVPDGEVEFVFDLSVARAAIGEDGSGAFEDGDRIGLYVFGSPSQHFVLTRENGAWRPKLKKSDLGDGKISAYYPAREDVRPEENRHIHAVAADQSGEGYAESDMLWAHREIDLSTVSNRIELPFAHGMHRLKIRLTSADGELPEDLSVEVRNRNEGSFSLFTGTPQDPGMDEVWITPHARETAGEFTALLFPQKLAPYTSGDGWLRIHAGDRTITYNAPNEIGGSKSFEAGKTTTLDLRLTDGNVEPDPGLEPDEEFRNKKLWIYGIHSPVYDPETVIEVSPGNPIDNYTPNVWVKYVYHWSDGTTTESWKLPWGEGCGWYDVNKTYWKDHAEDEYMCWAGASSNILHWWIDRNKEYVAAYDARYGNEPEFEKYPRPSADFSPASKSAIFRLFIDTFQNRGAGEGVSWFITGLNANTSGIDNPTMLDCPGYFGRVFKKTDVVYTDNRAMSKSRFNQIIKHALKNRQALEFTTNGNHAMTIWGAEFDDEGYVDYIYYADNNYGDQDPVGAACIRQKISYRKDAVMNLPDQAYMGTNTRISALGVADLRRDIWRQAFPDVQPED